MDGMTPRYLAATSGHNTISEILQKYENGIDTSLSDYENNDLIGDHSNNKKLALLNFITLYLKNMPIQQKCRYYIFMQILMMLRLLWQTNLQWR